MKNFRKNQGITLIALVITVIVLLILAGVTIATLTGDNGILTRAQEAKDKTEISAEDELRKLTILEAETHLEDYEYTDKSGKTITIPAKCAVSQVQGENTFENGLVIIDANGNEWVWIEVPKTVNVYMTAGLKVTSFTDEEYRKIYNDLVNYAVIYRDEDNLGVGVGEDEWYDGSGNDASKSANLDDTTGCGLTSEEYTQLRKNMLKSIYKNEGFFVGRYEVGIKEDTYRNYDEEYTQIHPINETPVIQANKYVYNWVTTSQAQELSQKLSIGGKTSSLIFGIQWDLILKYIETKNIIFGASNQTTQYKLKIDSSSCGNYSNAEFDVTNVNAKYSATFGKDYLKVSMQGYSKPSEKILLTTGATVRNSIAGIFDLAGNVDEWTLEKTPVNDYPCNIRGGAFGSAGSSATISNRYRYKTYYNYYATGFRATLY